MQKSGFLIAVLPLIVSTFSVHHPESHVLAEIRGKIQAQIEKKTQPWSNLSGSYRYCDPASMDSSCCLRDQIIDFNKMEGMENILAPRRMNAFGCSGDCPNNARNPFMGRVGGLNPGAKGGEKRCQPVSWEPADIIVETVKDVYKIKVPELVVRGCACI